MKPGVVRLSYCSSSSPTAVQAVCSFRLHQYVVSSYATTLWVCWGFWSKPSSLQDAGRMQAVASHCGRGKEADSRAFSMPLPPRAIFPSIHVSLATENHMVMHNFKENQQV